MTRVHFMKTLSRAGIALVMGGAAIVQPLHSPAFPRQRTQTAAQSRQESEAEEKAERAERAEKKPKSKRWQVSWGVDGDAARMSARPVRTTVARLLRFKRPKDLPGTGDIPAWYKTHRIKGVETVVWSIRGTVVNVAAEHDGDYRLIVADERGNQVTCVLPDPALAPKRGRFSDRIDAARAVVLKRFRPTFTPRDVRVPVALEGTGYFGKFNSDANKSPVGFQLHPVTKVRF